MSRAMRRPVYNDPELTNLAAALTYRLAKLAEGGKKTNPILYSLGGRDYRKFEGPVAMLHPMRPAIVMAYHGRDAGGFVLDRAKAEAYLKRLDAGFTGRHDE